MVITKREVLETLAEVVQDFGPNWIDHHEYNALTYEDGLHDLAGETLRRLGVTLPDVDHRLNHRGLHTVALEMFWPIEVDALDLLDHARVLNDKGVRWSVIVANMGVPA